MNGLEYVHTYLDDLLITSRGSFKNHIEKLEVDFQHMLEVGIHIHTHKCIMCAIEVNYLGYVITHKGIKPQPNKIKPYKI